MQLKTMCQVLQNIQHDAEIARKVYSYNSNEIK